MGDDYLILLCELAGRICALKEAAKTQLNPEQTKTKEQLDILNGKFAEIRNKYVDFLLVTPHGRSQAYEQTAAKIAELRTRSDPSWNDAINYLSEDLLVHLKREASRDPQLRKAIKAIPWALGGLAVTAYFGLRLFSATPIDYSVETREGIQQRAAAIEKVLRYTDWMDTRVRRGGWLMGILFWPVEPSKSEIEGAAEFAGFAYAAQKISTEDFGCPSIPAGYGDTPSEVELSYLSDMAGIVRRPDLQWADPPVMTMVDAARIARNCS